MRAVKKICVCMAFMALGHYAYTQEYELDQILDSAASRLNSIDSYAADALFSFDIDFIKMPDKKAKVRYKSPDKINVDTEGFILVPKMGLKPLQEQLKRENYHPVFDGLDEVHGDSCVIFKMIPKARNSKLIMSTLWIRKSDFLVMRIELFTKKSGSFLIDLKYDTEVLPSEMLLQFELEGMNIPLKYFGNEAEIDKYEFKNQEIKKGQVIIYFKNYQITYN